MMGVGLRSFLEGIEDARQSNYSSESVDCNRSVVMDYIQGYYKEALGRVPPSLIPRVQTAGFCFGFLDPVSNIIANTVSLKGSMEDKEANQEDEVGRGKKRKRSQAGTNTKKKGKRSTGSKVEEGMSVIAARSRRGLVTFLTTYFRYLPYSEAVRYLRLAKADLLVAVHLIEQDRDTNAFTIHLVTTKVDITCAALSAMRSKYTIPGLSADDPKIPRLVYSSLTLASRLDEVSPLLAIQGRLCSSSLRRLSKLSMQGMHGTADPRVPMHHAVSRFTPGEQKMSVTYHLELALSKVLLDRIHGFYLKAISCIPALLLRSRHHRGLLKAGHCYGPFDPVTNIILSTIWYDTAFPPQQEFEVDMICDESLPCTECRSFDGIVTFVMTLFPELSTYDATRYLLFNNARLDKVIEMATREGYHPSTSYPDAYRAAAHAAHHPNPTALANLATVLLPGEEKKLKSLLEAKRILSAVDIRTISTTLSRNYPPRKCLVSIQKLTLRANQVISAKRKKFEAHQRSVHRRVQAALKKHAQDKGEEYELLVICGVNGQIPKVDDCDYFADGYPYSHINIWARLKGSRLADAAPVLLFIQCSNDSKDKEDIPLCLPVSESSKDAGRCFHCECEGTKIVHTSSVTYLGQSWDFEEMARGEPSVSNEELIGFGGLKTIFVNTSEDAYIYFDPAWDADFAAFLNKIAKREEEEEDEDSAQAEANRVSAIVKQMAACIG